MEKRTMVEKVEYFCDLCDRDITNEDRHTCEICGRLICGGCHVSVKGWTNTWLTICITCKPLYYDVKDKMNTNCDKYEKEHKEYCFVLYKEWKEKSLLLGDLK